VAIYAWPFPAPSGLAYGDLVGQPLCLGACHLQEAGAADRLLGGVQSARGLGVSLDLHDDAPLPVEHPDRYDAVLVPGAYEGPLQVIEELG